jgi:hypothetical protein
MNRGQRRAQWRARLPGRSRASNGTDSQPARASQPVLTREIVVTPATINLRVGELSLHGFEGGHARRIADALQHSLTAMLSSQGIPDAWSRSSRAGRANAGALRLTNGASPGAIGEELARRVLAYRTDGRS